MKNRILTVAMALTAFSAAVAVLTAGEPVKGGQQLLQGGAKAQATATCVAGKGCATSCNAGTKSTMNCGTGCMTSAKGGHVHGAPAKVAAGGCAMGAGGCCAGKAPAGGTK